MTSLQHQVSQAFAPDGVLAQAFAQFSSRPGQQSMANEVARTMEDGGALVAEAGTGVGKTYAYLVPALLSRKNVLLSTATKALQDQLYLRDIPRLRDALGIPIRVALLKGRSSYLCTHRLSQAFHAAEIGNARDIQMLVEVQQWAAYTQTGDVAELPGLDERSVVIPLVTSTKDNCLGNRCPDYQGCHVNKARRQAMAADIVVINHHLFFADLQVRESGVAELLPAVHSVVFDEAHQLNEIGVQFLGQQFSTGQLVALGRDLLSLTNQFARGMSNWHDLASKLEMAANGLRHVVGGAGASQKLRWAIHAPVGINEQHWQAAMNSLQVACTHVRDALAVVSPMAAELGAMLDRVEGLLETLNQFAEPLHEGFVRWIDAGMHLRCIQSPLDIAQAMQHKVLSGLTQPGNLKSWIFTSATLGADPGLQWFTQTCGLKDARVVQIPSPFDYANCASLYVPTDFPKPNEEAHSTAVAQLAALGARQLGGRTLILTTTLRAMRTISEILRKQPWGASAMHIYMQGELPKRELIDKFLLASRMPLQASILVASASFWEGIDIPGDALQFLVIDKIPFAPPDDPLVQAKANSLQMQGRNPFQHLHIPQAMVALKQGAGRLIRSEADRGVLAICDVRLRQMSYGRKLLAALPAMKFLSTEREFDQAIKALTKPSTTDQMSACHP